MKPGMSTEQIEGALFWADLPIRPCGLNADWSVRAWHVGPGTRANREDEDGPQLYLIDAEDMIEDPDHDVFVAVRRTNDPETCEVTLEDLCVGKLEDAISTLRLTAQKS